MNVSRRAWTAILPSHLPRTRCAMPSRPHGGADRPAIPRRSQPRFYTNSWNFRLSFGGSATRLGCDSVVFGYARGSGAGMSAGLKVTRLEHTAAELRRVA